MTSPRSPFSQLDDYFGSEVVPGLSGVTEVLQVEKTTFENRTQGEMELGLAEVSSKPHVLDNLCTEFLQTPAIVSSELHELDQSANSIGVVPVEAVSPSSASPVKYSCALLAATKRLKGSGNHRHKRTSEARQAQSSKWTHSQASTAMAACSNDRSDGAGGQRASLQILLERLIEEGIIRKQILSGRELHPDLNITGFLVEDHGQGTERFKAEVIQWFSLGVNYPGPGRALPPAGTGGLKFSQSICQVFRRAGLVPVNRKGRGFNFDSFEWSYNAEYRAKNRNKGTSGLAKAGAGVCVQAAESWENFCYHGEAWSPPSTPCLGLGVTEPVWDCFPHEL